jgi:hypothetical protein
MLGRSAAPNGGAHNGLLPGEPPVGGSIEEARLWVRTYRQLHEIESAALETMKAVMSHADQYVRDELERTNKTMLAQDVDYFAQRLALWEQRLAEMSER